MCITEEELSRQELLNYVSEFIHVNYVPIECGSGVEQDINGDGASSPYRIQLMNVGLRTVIGGDWTIYFNQANGLVDNTLDETDGNLVVRHVDGWLFTLTLLPGRVLRPSSTITLRSEVRLASRTYAFPRWYRIRICQ